MNDDRNNSFQQGLISKYREKNILLLFIYFFFALLQLQTVTVIDYPLFKTWIKLSNWQITITHSLQADSSV